MAWQFESGLPIYRQLVDRIRMMIAGGEFKPGDRIPAVRELALEAGVNPNTMQKALAQLEKDGLATYSRPFCHPGWGDIAGTETGTGKGVYLYYV